MINYTLPKSNDTSFIYDVLDLDSENYSSELCGTFESVSKRYLKNKKSYILAYDGTKLVGYLCFLNISEELKARLIKSPIYRDDLINSDCVVPFSKNKKNTLYIISVVTKKDYQNKGIGQNLFNHFKSFINDMVLNGYSFDSIFAETVSEGGFKLLSNNSFKVLKTLKNGAKFVVYNFDDYQNCNIYAFIPCHITNGEYIKTLKNESYYNEKIDEICSTELNESVYSFKRRYDLDDLNIEVSNDLNTKKIKDVKAKAVIAIYKDVACLTLIIESIGFDPTYLLDNFSTNRVKITGFNSIKEYLESNGLEQCAETKTFTSLINKPTKSHLVFMLAGEEYIRGQIEGSSIVSKHFEEFANDDISQYNFSNIYCSERSVVYILREEFIKSHLIYDIYMTFIIERVILQLASVCYCNKTISNLLDKQNFKTSESTKIAKQFSKYSNLWILMPYKYALPNHLFSIVAQRFGLDKNHQLYLENFSLYEKLSSLESNFEMEKISNTTKKYFSFFTFLSTFGTINTVVGLIFSIINDRSTQSIVALSAGLCAFILLEIVLLIKIFKSDKKK